MSAEETNPVSEPKSPEIKSPEAKPGADTPGARLAAQKAAKAARKASKRGHDGEMVEEKALEKAALATAWYSGHRNAIWIGLLAVSAVVAGIVFWNHQTTTAVRVGGTGLWEGVETAMAQIRPAGTSTADVEGQSFDSIEARAKRATEQFRAAAGAAKSPEGAAVAELGVASALLDSGDFAGARSAFEKAKSQAGENALVRVRAIEGIAFSYEGEKAWDKADAQYTELRTVDFPRAAELADYHHARVLLAKGERDKAKDALKKLVDALAAEQQKSADERGPDATFVKNQAEARLAEIDPSLVKRSGSFGGGGGISQEELQRLLEQMQAQQGLRGE